MLYLREENKNISSNIIVAKDVECMNELQLLNRNSKYNEWSQLSGGSLSDILTSMLDKKERQSRLVKCGIDLSQLCSDDKLVVIEKVLHSNLDKDTKMYLLKNIPQFSLFNNFSTAILNSICIEKINEFNVDELLTIDEMSKKLGVWCESSNILESIDIADKNTKILSLAMKLNKKQ